MKYDVIITNIGDFVLQLLQLRESMVIFNKNVPYEYMDMVVAHTAGILQGELSVGDKVTIADKEYTISAIGADARQNLEKNGHCTLLFNGKDTVEQPGQIALAGSGIPRVMVGDSIRIF